MAVKTDAITAVKGCNPYDLFYTQECEYNTCVYRCMASYYMVNYYRLRSETIKSATLIGICFICSKRFGERKEGGGWWWGVEVW